MKKALLPEARHQSFILYGGPHLTIVGIVHLQTAFQYDRIEYIGNDLKPGSDTENKPSEEQNMNTMKKIGIIKGKNESLTSRPENW